jgi:polysaccharide pyruvyl transferase WcaK-like protein
VSLSLLRELLGPSGKDVSLAPDIVFLFAGESPAAGRKVLESLGVDIESGPLIGIAPNMRVYQRCRGLGAANEYIQLMIQVAEHCIQAWGASAILVPHEFSLRNVAQQDDRFLCGLIKVGVSQSERCFTLREYTSAPIIKSIEAHLDFMIGSRFHSCVFALSSCVPAVALGWAHKYPELMKLVGLDGNALIHTDFAEARVRRLLDEAWKVRAQSKATIREHLPQIRRQVKRVFDDTAELLGASDGESIC